MDIVLKNISKAFDGQTVLSNFSLVIPDGKRVCIMAPSGAGKTTLLNILMGLCAADSGEISGISGKKISVVFQEDRLIKGSDVYANLNAVRRSPLPKADLDLKLKALGMSDYKNKPVSELSGGMKRRVAILRALIADYDLLILDEPFKGLDEKLKKQVIEFVSAQTEGKTLLLVTHEAEEATLLGAEIHTLL